MNALPMPPPIHVTGAPYADWVIFIVGAIICLYWLRALCLAREGARLFLRNLLRAIIVFGAQMVVFTTIQVRTNLKRPKSTSSPGSWR